MLHYSNASSIEKNRRYLVIKGGACLVALARSKGRQHRSRTGVTGSLGVYRKEVTEGNTINKRAIKASQSITWQYAMLGVTYAVLDYTGEGGKHPGKYSQCFAFSDRWTGGGKLHVWYVRGVGWTNGLRIRNRLVVLSNFHVENILIRVTVYFLWFIKVLCIF